MRTRQIIAVLLLIIGVTSCNVSGRHIAGKYIDTFFGDTLRINSNNTYEYVERLYSGKLGWTTGVWKTKNRKVEFQCDHKPLVDYGLKVRKDTLSKDFQIRLELADTKKPIFVEDVKVLKNNHALGGEAFRKSKNVVKILAKDFDSVLVQTFNFTNLSFPNTLNRNHGYLVRIYPEERLYELDKVPFIIKEDTMKSTKTKEYDNILLSFRKIKD